MKILFLTHAYSRGANVVGAIHYANELSRRGHEVVLVTTPVSIVQIAFQFYKKAVRNKIMARWNKKGSVLTNEVQEVIPISLLPFGILPYLGTELSFRLNIIFTKLHVNWADVLIVESPFFFNQLHKAEGKIVYRATDNYSSFYRGKRLVHEEKLVALANKVIATSPNLSEHLCETYNLDDVTVIENGIDHRAFEVVDESNETVRDGVVYIGAFDFRFDFELLHMLSVKYPITIDLYGNMARSHKNILKNFSNIHYRGPVRYNDVPRTLRKYKVGIMPFKPIEANLARSPMKMYEYLCSGLSVVTMGLPDKNILNVYACLDSSDFCDVTSHLALKKDTVKTSTIGHQIGWEYKTSELLKYLGG